jgi:hypothetical protein
MKEWEYSPGISDIVHLASQQLVKMNKKSHEEVTKMSIAAEDTKMSIAAEDTKMSIAAEETKMSTVGEDTVEENKEVIGDEESKETGDANEMPPMPPAAEEANLQGTLYV